MSKNRFRKEPPRPVGQNLKENDRVRFGDEIRAEYLRLGWVISVGTTLIVESIRPDLFGTLYASLYDETCHETFRVEQGWWFDLFYEWDFLTLAEKELVVANRDGWRARREANLKATFCPVPRSEAKTDPRIRLTRPKPVW